MQWLYLDANQQQVPADENDLAGLVQNGIITRDTLLWNETLTDWQSALTLFPTWFPEPAPAPAPVASAPQLVASRPSTLGMVKRPIKTAQGGGGGRLPNVGRRTAPAEQGAEPQENVELIKDLASFIGVNAGWMKFLGVLLIIVGVMYCLTVVGVLVGWLPIWLGVVLYKAAGSSLDAQMQGGQGDMEDSLERISLFFKLQGIFMLITLILMIGSIVLAFTAGIGAVLMGGGAEGISIE